MAPFVDEKLKERIRAFNERGQLGPDPLGERYAERRAGYSLFAPMMSDADIEALRAYRKHVVKNVSRILAHYTEEFLHEIRQQIPKTRLEAVKDFFEAKRACDHLEGSFEAAIKGEMVPDMIAGQKFWRDAWLPAGLAAIITPMNFIYGIPMIH